jgi:hypothetical protein
MKQQFKKFIIVLALSPLFLLYSNCAGNGAGGFPSEGSQSLPSSGDNAGSGGVATPTPTPAPGSSVTPTPTPAVSPTVAPTATPKVSPTPTPTPVMSPTPTPVMTPTPTPSNPANPNGRWVLTGYGGRHMTSADGGKTWTNDVSDITNGGDDKYLQRAAIYFKNAFITLGWRIQRSTDGMTFQSSNFLSNWYGGVAEGVNRIVAVGACGNRAYSNDGINWTDLPDNTCSAHLRGVVYGNGIYFAYGDGGSRTISSDGLTWTKLSNYTVTGVAYGMGYFWGVNSATKVVRSTDGVTWTEFTVAGATGFGGFNFVNNSLILTTTTKNYRSLDGNTWSAFGSGMNGKIAYGGGVYIGITWQTVYRSTDGMTWSQVSKGGNSFVDLAWAP